MPKEQQVPKENRELKVHKVLIRELKVQQDLQELKVHKVLKVE